MYRCFTLNPDGGRRACKFERHAAGQGHAADAQKSGARLRRGVGPLPYEEGIGEGNPR